MPKPAANGRVARRVSTRSARWPEIGAWASKPQRRRIAQPAKPQGEAEAAADPAGEGGDREIAIPAPHRLDQRRQPRRRGAEVAVAEQDQARRRRRR